MELPTVLGSDHSWELASGKGAMVHMANKACDRA